MATEYEPLSRECDARNYSEAARRFYTLDREVAVAEAVGRIAIAIGTGNVPEVVADLLQTARQAGRLSGARRVEDEWRRSLAASPAA